MKWALDRDTLLQFLRYGLSGGAAVATHVLVLVMLVEGFGCPKTLASAVGFACATPVNYLLQHRFVFQSTGDHSVAFARYLAVTALTMTVNTLVFWFLADRLGLFYVASQILTIGLIVPMNFVLNRVFTFASPATEGS